MKRILDKSEALGTVRTTGGEFKVCATFEVNSDKRFQTFLRMKHMIPKYTIEYGTGIRLLPEIARYSTDDPVASTEFVRELLDRGLPLHAIKHEGVELPRHEFDLVVKNAASELAAKHICTSLGIKPEEEKFRFGFSA